ncbi:MAG TPA: hypothetical protein VIC71_11345 [Gammaproteobacteria bacterium]|jgi:hypothetical protein
MKHRVLFSSLAASLPVIAFAQSSDTYQCTMAGLTRRVEIAREGGSSVPCEVLYFKDSEAPGERRVLWSATNEAGYCESQAQGFVEKLEGLGWECQATPGAPAPAAAAPPAAPAAPAATATPAAPAAPADDTDALTAPPEPR